MDRSILWRAALLQAASVAAVSFVLALALPHGFFERWGWLAGPGAWAVCAAITATVLRLPFGPVMAGAALAGVASLLAVVSGAHWAGAAGAVVLFALWCAWLAGRSRDAAPHTGRV